VVLAGRLHTPQNVIDTTYIREKLHNMLIQEKSSNEDIKTLTNTQSCITKQKTKDITIFQTYETSESVIKN
jgi:hypothetical protein